MKLNQITVLMILAFAVNARAMISSVEVQRAEGVNTPLRVYTPNHSTTQSLPLILLSPGLGGNESSYGFLAQALADDGWRVIVIGHRESGRAPLRDSIRAKGLKDGVGSMVTDASLYRARQMDVTAALHWGQQFCKPPLIVLAGHSMGGVTTMIEAGAHNLLGLTGQDRFDAYVVLSPEGPQPVFSADAWHGIHKPVLMLTGTRDSGVGGDWHWRVQAYEDLPPGCAWLGIIDNASHFNFGGIGLGHQQITPLIVRSVQEFLNGLRSGQCPTLHPMPGLTLKRK
jgi:pimeloyl-ACP methyl ester carboxylesterase